MKDLAVENHFANAATLFEKLSDPSPQFRIWIIEQLKEKGRLETILAAVISSGNAKTPEEAFSWLNSQSKSIDPNNPYITSSDMWGKTQKNRFFELVKAVGEFDQKTTEGSLWRLYGITGHIAIPDLLSGMLRSNPRGTRRFSKTSGRQYFFQPDIFWENSRVVFPKNQQLSLFGEKTTGFFPNSLEDRELKDVLEAIKRAWKSLASLAEKTNSGTQICFRKNETERLFFCLKQVFGDHLSKIEKHGQNLESKHLSLLTAMTWATAFMDYRKKNKRRILFREIQVTEKDLGLSGGRIDALEVRMIDGKPPNRRQRNVLARMAYRRYTSVGSLLWALQESFGNNLEVVILDWKFAIGDGAFRIVRKNGEKAGIEWQIIKPADVKDEPLREHKLQLYRYLTLSSLDYHLLAQNRGITSCWPENAKFLRGEIVYFMPTVFPIIHNITMTPEKQNMFFGERVVGKWSAAQRRALIRLCDNRIFAELIRSLSGNPKNGNHQKSRRTELQQTFFSETRVTMADLVEENKEFLDPETKIIQVTGKNRAGNLSCELHFDKLLDAIKEEKIFSRDFSLQRGSGFIRCLNPNHEDQTPSLHLWLKTATFKCFSCGIGGVISPNSIPKDLAIPLRPTNWVKRSFDKTITCNVPDEKHIRIMALAQEILQSAFKKSDGEKYISKERKIDPGLAFAMGAGFGTDKLISGLLDSGFTLDDLIHYGFVRVSNAMSFTTGIGPLLKVRGFSEKEIYREIKLLKGKTVNGYPFSELHNRVTFPLSLPFGIEKEAVITNFYGRLASPNASKFVRHRKLTIEFTGIPQGGFNLSVIGEANRSGCLVAEGVMDAIVLMLAGYNGTVGIIGTNNSVILEEVVRSEKQIGIALDYDAGGLLSTQVLIDSLQRRGASVCDFTQSFVDNHPEMKFGMDFGEWWEKYGRRQKTKK